MTYFSFTTFNISTFPSIKWDILRNLPVPAGIIHNRLKVNAAIENTKAILALQKEFGSFGKWLEHHHPKAKEEWVKLFKKTFRFTGGEIVNEFLMSIGYLQGAHSESCPVHHQILKHKPMWANQK